MHKISRKEADDLLAVCKELIRYHEEMDASPNCYEYGFKADLATRLYDAVAAAEGRVETSYGGVIENDENI